MKRPVSPKIKFHETEKTLLVNPESKMLWEQFEIDLNIRELARGTIMGYHNDLVQLWVYTLEHFDNVSVAELSEDELSEFIYYCKERGANKSRIKREMFCLTVFYRFLYEEKYIKENPMDNIPIPYKNLNNITNNILTDEQIYRIKETLKIKLNNTKSTINRHNILSYIALTNLILDTGADATSISNMKWKSVSYLNNSIKDVEQRDGNLMTFEFDEETKQSLKQLKDFRKENGIRDNNYIFIARGIGEYHRASKNELSQWTKKIGSMIGVRNLQPHHLRQGVVDNGK